MEPHDWGPLGLQLLAGLGLAAAAGLRAFLPPFLLGLLARLDWIPLRPEFGLLESTPMLVILGTAVVAEVLGDKVPLVDHALDLLGTFLKPAAGTVVLAAAVTDLGAIPSLLLGLLAGGGTALTVHAAKSGLRLASTGTTSGLGNPLLSIGEDLLAVVATLAAVFIPLLLIAVLVLGLVLLRRVVRWMQERIRPAPATRA